MRTAATIAETEPERGRRLLIELGLTGDDGGSARLRPGELAGRMLVAADDDRGKAVAQLAGEIPVGSGEHLGQRMPLAHQRAERVAPSAAWMSDSRPCPDTSPMMIAPLRREREDVEEVATGGKPLRGR